MSTLTRRAFDTLMASVPDPLVGLTARANRATKPRFFREMKRWQSFLTDSQRWSADRLAAYQWDELRRVLEHAAAHVPYYRDAFAELDAEPSDIKSFDDFRRLPTITKQTLQESGAELLADNWPPDAREYATTGGSTGVPVGFWMDKTTSLASEWAFLAMTWGRAGYRPGGRVATLRGEPIPGGRLWRRRAHLADLQLSSYHLTEAHMPALLRRLRAFRPHFVMAYPSSLSLLADFMLAREEPPIESIKGIAAASENFYAWQRDRVERAFGCRAVNHYGQSERVVLAGECELSHDLHIFPEYGVAELLDGDGRPIDEPGQIGEIVGTGFHTRSMPLIRYRTGDAAAWREGYCDACGRKYRRFDRVEGRLQEFIVSATGRPISMTAINFHTSVFDNVHQFRFYQDTPGKVELRLVPKQTWRAEVDEPRIRDELRPKLGDDTELVKVELVSEIPVGKSGKYQFLDQRLPLELVRL